MNGAFLGIDVMEAALAGGLIGGGVLLLVMALRGMPARPHKPTAQRTPEEALRGLGTRGGVAVILGAAVLVISHWLVAAIGVGFLVFGWNSIAGGAAEERRGMARLEGLAAWTESLRDTIAGAVGLEQAIPSSLRAAAPSLQPALRSLVDRLQTRVPMADALRLFADELDDPSADLVIGALMLNARLRGPGLREMLGALATSARAELDMRRRVEAQRRTTRRSVQIVVGFSVGVALLLTIFNPSYVAPYDTFLGQVMLVVVIGLFAAGFVWMRRLATYDVPDRLLTSTEGTPGVPPGGVPETVAGWQGAPPLRGHAATDAGGGRR